MDPVLKQHLSDTAQPNFKKFWDNICDVHCQPIWTAKEFSFSMTMVMAMIIFRTLLISLNQWFNHDYWYVENVEFLERADFKWGGHWYTGQGLFSCLFCLCWPRRMLSNVPPLPGGEGGLCPMSAPLTTFSSPRLTLLFRKMRDLDFIF